MRNIILYDANTVGSEYVSSIYREVAENGEVAIKRAYGNFAGTEKEKYIKAGFVICDTEPEEKHVSCQMIVDAMDLANNTENDSFVIASSDEYILPLILKLREKGKTTMVYGSSAMSSEFINACGGFRYLDILNGNQPVASYTDIKTVISDIYRIINRSNLSSGCLSGEEITDSLQNLHPEFDVRNYSYSTILEMIKANMPDINIIKENGKMIIEQVDNKADIESYMVKYLAARENKIDDMEELFEALALEFEHFDIKNYGYTSDIAFILSFPKLEIYENKGVKLKQSFKLAENPSEK